LLVAGGCQDIAFEPDSSKGNSGPGTMAKIEDGRYRNDPGEGLVGGHYILKVYGYDGKNRSANRPQGEPLFPPRYRSEAEFGPETSTFDVNVPPDQR
jgi:hypothetical protein